MKKTLLILTLTCTVIISKADIYSQYCLNLTITTSDQLIDCYMSVSPLYFNADSIGSEVYLMSKLKDLDFDQNNNQITFYRNKIDYKVRRNTKGQMSSDNIFYFLNKDSISVKRIRAIHVNEILSYSSISGIANKLSLKDTTWLNSEVLRYEITNGYPCESYGGYCGFELFFHETNSTLDSLTLVLKTKVNEVPKSTSEDTIESIIKEIMKYKVIVLMEVSE